jgi:hypothetical protein
MSSDDPVAESKSQEVQDLLKRLVEGQGVPVLHISAFGYKYDSAFWIAVGKDAERDALQADRALLERLRGVFDETGYRQLMEDKWQAQINNPQLDYLRKPAVTFESQETVDRDYAGNWYHRLK